MNGRVPTAIPHRRRQLLVLVVPMFIERLVDVFCDRACFIVRDSFYIKVVFSVDALNKLDAIGMLRGIARREPALF